MPKHTMRARSAALLLCLAAACADAGTTGEAAYVVERTTSGDTTVVHVRGTPPAADSLRLEEVWRATSGDGTGESAFSRIVSIARAPDGTLYVLDDQAKEIYRIDADGTPRGLVGRQGGGPGEYTNVNGMATLSDGALVVWDAGGSRLVTFAPDGTHRATFSAPVSGFYTFNGLAADTADRLWLTASWRVPEVRDSSVRIRIRLQADGTMIDTLPMPLLGPEPPFARIIGPNNGRTIAALTIPFSPAPGADVEARGSFVRWPGDAYVVLADRAEGVLRIERDMPPVPVSDAERDARRAEIEGIGKQFDPNYAADFTVPATKPPISSVRAGDDGTLWVSIATPSREVPPAEGDTSAARRFLDEPVYHVYAHDGTPIGVLQPPAQSGLFVATRDFVWGTVRDEDGVPTVVAWRVVRANGDR